MKLARGQQQKLSMARTRRLKKAIDYMAIWQGKVDAALEGTKLSFLELKSLGPEALQQQYLKVLGVFCDSASISRATLHDDALMDERLVTWMNAEFIRGQKPWRGEKALAALMPLVPAYSK